MGKSGPIEQQGLRGGTSAVWWSRQYIVIHASSTLTTSVRFLAKTFPFPGPLRRFTSLQGSASPSNSSAQATSSNTILPSSATSLALLGNRRVSRWQAWRHPGLNHPSRLVTSRQRTVLRFYAQHRLPNCQLLISILTERRPRTRVGVLEDDARKILFLSRVCAQRVSYNYIVTIVTALM